MKYHNIKSRVSRLGKLRSFTLLEVIIALALTSIIIMFAMLYFHYINNFCHSTMKVHDAVFNEMFFRNQIIEDFNKAKSITSTTNNIITLNYNENSLTYEFSDSVIIRSGQSVDTFKLQNSIVELIFIDDKEYFLQSINFKIINHDLIHNVYITKDYDNYFKYHILK
jgi:competence protein ComGF